MFDEETILDEDEEGFENEADLVHVVGLDDGNVMLLLSKGDDEEPYVVTFSRFAFAAFLEAGAGILRGEQDEATFCAIETLSTYVGEA